MSIETKEKTIDGKRITVVQLPARRALKLQAKLVKLFGSSLAALLSGSKGSIDANLTPAVLSGAVEKLAANLEENDFLRLVLEILQSTRVDNQEAGAESTFDQLFAGSFLFMYKVVGFTLEVNYADFFDAGGIGSLLEKARPATSAPAVSPNDM